MRTTRLKGHRESLPGYMHYRMPHKETHTIEAHQRFKKNTNTHFRADIPPDLLGLLRSVNQRGCIGSRISDLQRHPPGRFFQPYPMAFRVICDFKRLTDQSVKIPLTVFPSRFSIKAPAGNLRKGSPELTRFQRRNSIIQ